MSFDSFKTFVAANLSIILLAGAAVFVVGQGEVSAQPEITIDPEQPTVEEEEVDLPAGVVIQVNDETVSEEEFEQEVEQVIQQQIQMFEMQGQEMPDEQVDQLRDGVKGQVARQMIDQRLLISEARAAGIEIETEEAQEFLEEQFDSPQERDMALQQLGISLDEAEEEIREMLLIQEFMEQEIGEIDITEREARQHFEQHQEQYQKQDEVRARHILKEDEGEVGELEDIKEKIEADEVDFAQMAQKHSDDPSAERGGDLGFFGRQEMVEPFAAEAFDMVPGEIRGPVQTQFGQHLIKVEEIREGEDVEFEEVKDQITQQLQQHRQEDEARQIVEELRDEAQIKKDPSLRMPVQQPQPGQQPAPQPSP